MAYSSLRKRVMAWDPILARARLRDYLEGRECKQKWRKAKWNVSALLKELKILKRKVELKEKRTKMWSWREKCTWENFTPRKTRRMHRETASEMGSLPWSQNNGKENAARIKVSTRGPGSSWSYWCTKQLATKCLVIVQGDCSTCPPKQSHKWARA